MAEKLTGRASLLQREIEALERQERMLTDAIGERQPPNQRLADLRQELHRELATKRLVMFGTSHDIQDKGHNYNDELSARLAFLAEKFAPTVLLEEWAADREPSFASEFASSRSIVYKNVGPPPLEEFKTLGFAPINFPGHYGTLGPCCGAPAFYEYGPLEKQENRERRMVENSLNEMKNHQVGIFVVGLAHLHSMFSLVDGL